MHCRYVIDLLYIQLATVRSFMTFDAIEEIHIYMYSPNGVGSTSVSAPAPLRPCAPAHATTATRAHLPRYITVPITHRHGRTTRPRTCTGWYLLATTALSLSTCPLDQYHCQNGMPKWRPDISLFLQTSPTTAHHAGYGSAPSTRRSLRQDNLPGFFPPSSDGGVSVLFFLQKGDEYILIMLTIYQPLNANAINPFPSCNEVTSP